MVIGSIPTGEGELRLLPSSGKILSVNCYVELGMKLSIIYNANFCFRIIINYKEKKKKREEKEKEEKNNLI